MLNEKNLRELLCEEKIGRHILNLLEINENDRYLEILGRQYNNGKEVGIYIIKGDGEPYIRNEWGEDAFIVEKMSDFEKRLNEENLVESEYRLIYAGNVSKPFSAIEPTLEIKGDEIVIMSNCFAPGEVHIIKYDTKALEVVGGGFFQN